MDRQSWEAWFNTLTGDYRAGAEYWAAHRSLPNPGSCNAAPPSTGADWVAGCFAAQQRLTPSDVRRKTEPEYRLGWNNPPPVAASPDPQRSVATLSAAPPTPTADVATTPVPAAAQLTATNDGSPTQQDVTSRSSNKSTETEGSSGFGGLILLFAFLIGGCAIVGAVLAKRATRRRQEETVRTAAAEIDRNAANLRIKRIQLVQPDQYGTIFLNKWEAEKQYYLKTRILPLIQAKGLAHWYEPVAYTIDALIEEAAQRLVSAGEIGTIRFVSDPEVFDVRMDPLDYERHCALELGKAGWSTRLTAATGDQGADVIAHRDGKILVVQCKLYSQPVGNDAVQQVHAARSFQSADIAAVVSNQPFTKSAQQLANVNGVHLLHHEQLCQFTG